MKFGYNVIHEKIPKSQDFYFFNSVGELQIVTKTVTGRHQGATYVQIHPCKISQPNIFSMYFLVTFFLICFLVIGLKGKKLLFDRLREWFCFGFRSCEIHENELNPITQLRADTRNEVARELYDEQQIHICWSRCWKRQLTHGIFL